MNLKLMLLPLALNAVISASAASPWPGGAKAAVSLTYDDSPPSHLKNAIPDLDRAGLKGTFFVNPGQHPFQTSKAGWAAAAKAGHEVASHTMTHPCSRDFSFVPKGQGLEDLDSARMKAQIDDTVAELQKIGIKQVLSFAYPCGQKFFGADKASYIPMLKAHHRYARGVGHTIADPATVDLYDVPAFDGAKPLADLLALTAQATKSGGWLVFFFHGVGGDHLAVDGKVHQEFLKYLKQHPKEFWVAPFGEVAANLPKSAGQGKTVR